MAKFGREPADASWRTSNSGTSFAAWRLYRQSATGGQTAHPSPPIGKPWDATLGTTVYSFQLADAASSRSMIVGTHRTGLGRYGPSPARSGTQDGSICTGLPGAARQRASSSESQPQPLRGMPGT